jgi:RNA polymerase sigma-70 factor (ECF subfamily)
MEQRVAEGYSQKSERKSPERRVMDEAREGGHGAFSELVGRHARQMYHTSLKILKNQEDAEDNVQNALCKAFSRMDQFKGNSQFSTWLVRITINEALMMLRKQKWTSRMVSLDDGEDETGTSAAKQLRDQGVNPERACISKDLARKTFRNMPGSLADVFLLQKLEGWTNRELGEARGIPSQTVKSRVFRARVMLHRRLVTLSNNEPMAIENERMVSRLSPPGF